MDEIGVDAARWYLVNRGPDQTIDIDVDLAAEKTQKNPVYYVQYAHARIAGILRNAPNRPSNTVLQGPEELAPEEKELIKRLVEFPGSSKRRSSVVGRMRYRTMRSEWPTTSTASTTSTACSRATSRSSGSRSVRATQIVIALSLNLVGVEAPERM